jgi:Xaa-Pro aminopeptidase
MRLSFHQVKVCLATMSLVLALAVGCVTGLETGRAGAAVETATEFWRIAPPPPARAAIDRARELAQRRQQVLERMGNRSIMLLLSAEPRVYNNDTNYHYRQENNLYYLTGIKQEKAVLMLAPGATRAKEILFLPERNPFSELWNGRMMSREDARRISGIEEVWDMRSLGAVLAFLAPRAKSSLEKTLGLIKTDDRVKSEWRANFEPMIDAVSECYLLLPDGQDLREFRHEHELGAQLGSAAGWKLKSAHPIFAELRLRKSPWEQQLIQHAVDITAEAFFRSFAVAAPAMHEYEIHAEFDYTFRRRNADNWGYPCIVGAGNNATTLHYVTNQDVLDDGSLLLMDCGAEYDHYSADITRTIPVNGKFTPAQAEIYRIVHDAQMAGIKAARAGNHVTSPSDEREDVSTVHGAALAVIKDGLLRLGLITSTNNDEYRTWFMHGTSHWLGMSVHDVGSYSTPLAPGMVLTVEPGIYIRPDALDRLPKNANTEQFIKAVRPAFEKYKGIGIRIEDDILVTAGGPRILSAAIPSRLDEVESTITKLRRELQRSGWPMP